MEFPEGKRYNSFAADCRSRYGERLQKLVVDAGFTCPNRDGTVGVGGCTYCDNAAFHPGYSTPGKSIAEQLDEGIAFHRVRYPRAKHYLAYFQAYSNTYAPLDRLKALYGEALAHPSVVGIVIGTRPDCIDVEKLDFLASLQTDPGCDPRPSRNLSSACGDAPGPCGGRSYPRVTLEYGIESTCDATLERIHRGHDFACARRAVEMTAARGIPVGAHFILGLPGETRRTMLERCAVINSLPLTSVKFHQLQLVRGTAMEKEYAACPGDFVRFGLDEYVDFLVDILERLRPGLRIERIAGEVPPRFVGETPWGLVRNFQLLRLLDARLEARGTWQGKQLPGGAGQTW